MKTALLLISMCWSLASFAAPNPPPHEDFHGECINYFLGHGSLEQTAFENCQNIWNEYQLSCMMDKVDNGSLVETALERCTWLRTQTQVDCVSFMESQGHLPSTSDNACREIARPEQLDCLKAQLAAGKLLDSAVWYCTHD